MPMMMTGMGFATPGEPIPQDELRLLAHAYNAHDGRGRSRLDRLYRGTQVLSRYSVLTTSGPSTDTPIEKMFAFYPDPASANPPDTTTRMAVYEQAALPLAAEACRNALADGGIQPEAVTQLVTVSCTGFSAPGLDLRLLDSLGLAPGVGRTHIGFMGCHGAINGMRVAEALAARDPAARVLLCCAELCTLHFQYGDDPQDAVSNALFGDGAAALVVTPQTGQTTGPSLRACGSVRLPDSADLMGWRIGNHGFQMALSPEVPAVVERSLPGFLRDWLEPLGLSPDAIGGWAIHPGGPKVIDAAVRSLGLAPESADPSRGVLSAYGNMSSPTVLFILDRLRRSGVPRPWVTLAFGPGLVVEAALIV